MINMYLNPRVLIDHPQLHVVAAQISQLFIEKWALPIANRFKEG